MDERVLTVSLYVCLGAVAALTALGVIVGYLVWKIDEFKRANDALVRAAVKSKAYIHRNETGLWNKNQKPETNDTQVFSREDLMNGIKSNTGSHEIQAHSRKPRPRRS